MKTFFLIISIICTINTTIIAQTSKEKEEDYVYVFTEQELRQFLTYHINKAVTEATAELLRQQAIQNATKDHTINTRDMIIADYQKQLKDWPAKQTATGIISAIVGIAAGLIAGAIAF